MRIAFYAPMKAPNHPTPSGDRRVAALYRAAWEAAGHEVVTLSGFRSYEGTGDDAKQARLVETGAAEAARLVADLRARPAASRPDAWFTYHLYYKAPDWLGPAVGRALVIPYLVAEASFAGKRAEGAFARFHREAVKGIAAADALFCPTRLDMAALSRITDTKRLHHLPPFLDPAPFADAARARRSARARLALENDLDPARPWLLAVGMMRLGDKLASYAALGAALAKLAGHDFQLLVVGDGPARGKVTAHLAPLGQKVRYLGQQPWDRLPEIYAAADLTVWPAENEAYGMALLEAAAAGCAVVAGRVRGVPEVVRENETGLLAEPGNSDDFAAKVQGLLTDKNLRERFGRAGAAFVAAERSLERAAAVLDRELRHLKNGAVA